MTLDKAIKEQEDALADKWCPWGEELKASIRLGIEALKRYKLLEEHPYYKGLEPLPGETKE